MQEVGKPIGEEDLLYVASHFPVENARIAALTGCLEMLRGQTPARIAGWGTRRIEELQMRKIVYGSESPELKLGYGKMEPGGWMVTTRTNPGMGNSAKLWSRGGMDWIRSVMAIADYENGSVAGCWDRTWKVRNTE